LLLIITEVRGGKDLKVGLFGVEQVLHKQSPYSNPTDSNRCIFRYAPGITIIQYPFLLDSKLVAPFIFKDMSLSIAAWYLLKILSLVFSAFLLVKLIPSPSPEESFNNLKLSFLLALPLIGYELSNGQNKLIALFFLLTALFFFERKKMVLAALLFNLAMIIYIPLFIFIFYFTFRSKGRFIVPFIVAAFVIFGVIPSVVFGPKFNIFLLKEWFFQSLRPFLVTNSYATYIDLRDSSQSLPSTIGRLFVTGKTGSFRYLLPPTYIHLIIRVSSAIIVALSILPLLRRAKRASRGLEYVVFLILAMILPQYCLYYTWAWLYLIYFAIFNYVSYPDVPRRTKKVLLICAYAMFLSSSLIGAHIINYLSNFFWSTFILWIIIVAVLIQERSEHAIA
jgi:hypothetical protein